MKAWRDWLIERGVSPQLADELMRRKYAWLRYIECALE